MKKGCCGGLFYWLFFAVVGALVSGAFTQKISLAAFARRNCLQLPSAVEQCETTAFRVNTWQLYA